MFKFDTKKQLGYSVGKCFKTRLRSGLRPDSIAAIFSSIALLLRTGGFIGNCKAHGYVHVLNTRPPITLQNVFGGVFKPYVGVSL